MMKKFFNIVYSFFQNILENPSRSKIFTTYSPYLLIGLISFLALCLFACATSWIQYHNVHNWAKKETSQAALRLDKELKKLFQENEDLLRNIGKEILKSQPEDLMQIWNDVKEVYGDNDKSWPTLGWITPAKLQIVNSKTGRLREPIDMSIREYLQEGKESPWKLIFSKSGPACPPELFGTGVIPFGMAIVNDADQLVGYCAAAYNCAILAKNLDRLINNRSINFVLFDHDGDIVLESPKTSVKQDTPSTLPTSFTKKIDETPFTIVTYFSNEEIDNILHQVIAPRLIKIMTEGTSLVFLICFFLHGVINKNQQLAETKRNLEQAIQLAHQSDKAKEEFLRSVKENLKAPFITIVTYTDILFKQLKGDIHLDLSDAKQIDFLNRIEQACLDLETLTTQVVDLVNTDIKSLLEDCLTIISKEAFIKGVVLESHISPLPNWIIDELRFKQIIVGLLCHSLQFCRKGDRLFVNASFEDTEKNPHLKITIKDNGIGLSEEERCRVQTIYQGSMRISPFTNGTSLELSSIERLVVLLQGTYHIVSTWEVGTEVTLSFPYCAKDEMEFSVNDQN